VTGISSFRGCGGRVVPTVTALGSPAMPESVEGFAWSPSSPMPGNAGMCSGSYCPFARCTGAGLPEPALPLNSSLEERTLQR
jgi:hypothetical protein